jgi:adenosylcobinamide kinase/adenosylcobinamide-phosphate guanylyltransferase
LRDSELGNFVLITGGARSGKSRFAEKIAREQGGPVAYIATAAVLDEEMAARVARHKARRPSYWVTIEETDDLTAALAKVPAETKTVLVDCLTVWLTNRLLAGYKEDMSSGQLNELEKNIRRELSRFCRAASKKSFRTIIVTNEVGCGLVPDYPLGRIFRDLAGRANQQVAKYADSVWLTVAGYPLCVKNPGKK